MKYIINYEPEAEKALETIAFYYIEQVGLDFANGIMQSIKTAIDSLEIMPERCQKTDFSNDIHRLIIAKPPYSVYFLISGQKVIILDILHNRRDQSFLKEKYKIL